MKKLLFPICTLALMCSCSKIEKLEKNMDSMTNRTTNMSQTTDDMKDTTAVMYQQIRSKEAEDTRNKKMAILKDREQNFGAKIAAAAVYYKSFEYQLWTGHSSYDNLKMQELLYIDAASEFTKQLTDIYDSVNLKKMSPTNDGKKYRMEQAFYALAVTVHMNHHYQELMVPNKDNRISMLKMLKNALSKDINGRNLTEYEEMYVAGPNRQMIIELLKARVDMLAALSLKNMTDKKNMSVGQTVKGAIFKITGGKLGSIELPETLVGANEATLKQTETYLEEALNTKKFLNQIGVEKDLEKTLKSAYQHLAFAKETDSKNGQMENIVKMIEAILE